MYGLAGLSGAGVALQTRPTPSPDDMSSDSKCATPRSLMGVRSPAGDYEETRTQPLRHPLAEGNLRLLNTV